MKGGGECGPCTMKFSGGGKKTRKVTGKVKKTRKGKKGTRKH